ncbi:hypothetical protein VTK73DRAFT_3114 [Phialemonium thermophilum]|uniref:Uncharacterized protein n=1 Tax=Phialemonium thermophilum TaxID=223376 RepID=A0ABR3VKZ1_9PEZI
MGIALVCGTSADGRERAKTVPRATCLVRPSSRCKLQRGAPQKSSQVPSVAVTDGDRSSQGGATARGNGNRSPEGRTRRWQQQASEEIGPTPLLAYLTLSPVDVVVLRCLPAPLCDLPSSERSFRKGEERFPDAPFPAAVRVVSVSLSIRCEPQSLCRVRRGIPPNLEGASSPAHSHCVMTGLDAPA